MTRKMNSATLLITLLCGSALASTITWQSSVDLFAGGDNANFISTNGDSVLAFNAGATPSTEILNGVTFTAAGQAAVSNGVTGVGGVTLSFNALNGAGPTTFVDGEFTDAAVSAVINSAAWSGTDVAMTGLSIGQEYELQILVNDARAGGPSGGRDTSWEVGFTDGVGNATITGIADLNNSSEGSSASISGDYIIGTFTADATTQSFLMGATRGGFTLGQAYANVNGGQSQINGLQLRAIPEPASLGLIGIGAGLVITLRRLTM